MTDISAAPICNRSVFEKKASYAAFSHNNHFFACACGEPCPAGYSLLQWPSPERRHQPRAINSRQLFVNVPCAARVPRESSRHAHSCRRHRHRTGPYRRSRRPSSLCAAARPPGCAGENVSARPPSLVADRRRRRDHPAHLEESPGTDPGGSPACRSAAPGKDPQVAPAPGSANPIILTPAARLTITDISPGRGPSVIRRPGGG